VLSCQPDHDDGTGDNEQVIALPDSVFIHMISVANLDQTIWAHQKKQEVKLEEWRDKYQLEHRENV
jgi:hypothetical protein